MPYPRPAVTVRDVAGYHHDHAPIGAAKVVADVVYVASISSHQTGAPSGDSRAGLRRRCLSPRGPDNFRTGAPGAGDDLAFCGQHKTNTIPGSGQDQHGNNTDKTVLPGTRRHAC